MRRFREIIVAVESSKYYILCVSLALVIQNVKRMRRIVICGFSVSIIFFYFISQTAWFSEIKLLNTKIVFWFFYTSYLKHFLG